MHGRPSLGTWIGGYHAGAGAGAVRIGASARSRVRCRCPRRVVPIAVLTTLNVSAQIALPRWMRGRDLAAYATFLVGAMTLGNALWGEIAALINLPAAHYLAAAGALAAIALLRRWKLHSSTAWI